MAVIDEGGVKSDSEERAVFKGSTVANSNVEVSNKRDSQKFEVASNLVD